MSKPKNIALWVATVLVAGMFLFAGAPKLAGKMAGAFTQMGFPPWFSYLIGALEVGGALLLLWPRTASVGGAVLVVIMIGAVATLLKNGMPGQTPFPIVVGIVSAFIAWERRHQLGRGGAADPVAGAQGDESPRAR